MAAFETIDALLEHVRRPRKIPSILPPPQLDSGLPPEKTRGR
jgi:hypothetical protein